MHANELVPHFIRYDDLNSVISCVSIQTIDGSVIGNINTLCEQINDFFTGLTSHFSPLSLLDVCNITVSDIPQELFATPNEAEKALQAIQLRKAPGPDGLPNIILKEFAFVLGPVISNIYNASLREGYIPSLLKSANVRPLPKQTPACSIQDDVRPVSLTCQVAKVMEGLTLARILPLLLTKLDSKQFAVAGKSTVQAVVYLLHLALEALDKGNCSVRFFFTDFSKGFDLIDHHILLDKLGKYELPGCLVRWVAAFLIGRTQRVCLDSSLSSTKMLNGGIPQGTRLGSILFAVMVDDLLRSWGPRVKFVDDLTVLEIVPRNSPSVMRYIANDIHSFAINNNMRLNAKKCKLLPVSFLHYDSSVWPPLFLAGAEIDSVESFKFLGIYISSDLSCTKHCDVMVKKANRRLYAIRKLKGARVKENNLVAVYCSLIRSILEYGSVAFAHLPNYLSNTLEGIQKRALSIIYPESSYDVALKRSNLTTLVSRRADACCRFIESIQPNNPLYHIIKHNCAVRVDKPYNLRHKSEAKVPYNTFRFRNFVTYKYS